VSGPRTSPFRATLSRRLENLRWRTQGAAKAKLSGAERFGEQPRMAGRVRFGLRGVAVFGDRFLADGMFATIAISVQTGAHLSVGDDVYMNGGTWLEVWHDVRIGNNVKFGPYSSLIDDNRHEVEPGAQLFKGPVIIGNDVWLGRNVSVMPGVHIGDGSVIGAHSIVTSDIPPKSFAAGAPARVIKELKLPEGWIRL
jgi:acetyltransferase-like isoleucine patch superfamily enzyme